MRKWNPKLISYPKQLKLSLETETLSLKKEFFFKKRGKIQVSTIYKTHIQFNDTQKLTAKSWKRVNHADNKRKLVLQWCNNVESKEKGITRERRSLLNDKRDSSLGHIIIMNPYVPNNIASK